MRGPEDNLPSIKSWISFAIRLAVIFIKRGSKQYTAYVCKINNRTIYFKRSGGPVLICNLDTFHLPRYEKKNGGAVL